MLMFFLGRPGSGKSTTAKAFAERSGTLYISTGDIARTMGQQSGQVGNALARGEMAPKHAMDDLMVIRLPQYLGLTVDGYPRYMEQLADLLVSERVSLRVGVLFAYVHADAAVCASRLLARGEDGSSVQRRMDLYAAETQQVVSWLTRRIPMKTLQLDGIGDADDEAERLFKFYEDWGRSGRNV